MWEMDDVPVIGLTLILGHANSGKLGRVLQWWESRLGLQPLIVVPTSPDARSLSAEMAERKGALIGQSPAVTFDGLVRLLLGRAPRYIGDFERTLLVSHLLREEPPRAQGFSAEFPGMAGVTAALLQQLGDSGRSLEEIGRLLARWAAADAGSAALAADIERLLARYSALRDQLGLCDRSDAVREALGAASEWRRPLAFYGFTSFTLAQRKLLETLAGNAEILLVLDADREDGAQDIGYAGLTTPEELRAWERSAAGRVEVLRSEERYTSLAGMYLERHFAENLSPDEPAPVAWDEEDGGVRFLLASGQRNEAELAAQQIAERIRCGTAPGQIAVIVRSTKTWGRLLEDVLLSCGIPCEVDERVALGETGLGHAFLAGVRGVAADDAEAVADYLRGPFSLLTLEQAADVELAYLRGTARGVQALARSAESLVQGSLQALMDVVVTRGGERSVDLDAAQRLGEQMLSACLTAFARAASGPERAGTAALDMGADARAARALRDALSELSAFRTEGSLPEGVLRVEVLLPALARVGVAGAPTAPEGAVQVLTAHRARARLFDTVFILGLVEGEFPRRGDRPGLLTPAQRTRLENLGGEVFNQQPDDEEALFVRALSRARRHLFLSARDADDAGGFAGQSYYWSRSKMLLGVEDSGVIHRTLADQVYPAGEAPSMRHYLRACAAGGLQPHDSCRPAPLAPPSWTRSGSPAGFVSDAVKAELAATGSFSPSSLESYLKCPFSWFIERVVGADDMETLADNRVTGELLHQVLRDTFLELKSREALPLRRTELDMAQAIAAGLVDAAVNSDRCPGTVAERRVMGWKLRGWVREVLAMEADAESSLQPFETETTVGGVDGVDVGGLALRGRVDRIDHSTRDHLFIVDYKSGSVPSKNKIGTEEALQLPLYMLALAAERPDAEVVGGVYLSAKDRKRTGVAAPGSEDLLGKQVKDCATSDEEGFQAMLEGALGLAKQAAGGMRRGDILPQTRRKCPDYCQLGPVCRARRG